MRYSHYLLSQGLFFATFMAAGSELCGDATATRTLILSFDVEREDVRNAESMLALHGPHGELSDQHIIFCWRYRLSAQTQT